MLAVTLLQGVFRVLGGTSILPFLAIASDPAEFRDLRIGDPICYISDLSKMRRHYPAWDITVSLEETIRQIVAATQQKLKFSQALSRISVLRFPLF